MSKDRAEEFDEATRLLNDVMAELYPAPGEAQARLAELEAQEALGLPGSHPAVNVPVDMTQVRWERPTARSFWNALADPEREALAAVGVEQVFPAGTALCREGDDTSQVMIIDSGWAKVSVRAEGGGEKILAVRGQGDVIGERAALTMQVRSATVTALVEVSALVVQAGRFAEFLLGHPRAADVLQRQVRERREETLAAVPGHEGDAEQRLAQLLSDLAQRRPPAATVFTLPMSHHELADWAGTSAEAVDRFLRSWRARGIIARSERARRVTVVDLGGLAAIGTRISAKAMSTDAADGGPGRASARIMAEQVAIRWQDAPGEELNCSVLITDLAGFRDQRSSDADRQTIRVALYEIMWSALEMAGVPREACFSADRGDGVLIVVPPTIATLRVVDPLIPELADRLWRYNHRASAAARIQLRVALHAGPVGMDAGELTGRATAVAGRILDAPLLRERLVAEQADLIFATSDYVYDHVIRNRAGRVGYASFEPVEVQARESRISAWIHLAGPKAPPSQRAGLELTSPAAGTGEPTALSPAIGPADWPGSPSVMPPLGRLPAEVRGRERLLGELRRALRPYPWRASRAFVITGMGGLGKSTVALAAARMARDRGCRVWWVSATDTASLTSGILEVLRDLDAPESVTLPVREGSGTAPERAWAFLNGQHGAGRRWMLVLDGADNPAALASTDAATPADGRGWLRADPAGMLIVTSRNRNPEVWGTAVTLRDLRPLDDESGGRVLRDLAPRIGDPGGREALALARRLSGIPLTLHLAGTYLGSPFARWSSFADYRQALDRVDLSARVTGAGEPGGSTRADVQRTWDLALDALTVGGRPQASPLLLILGSFAPAIPVSTWLLQPGPLAGLLGSRADPGNDDTARRMLREGLQGLADTGLIEISDGGPAGADAITVHPIVATAGRNRLSALTRAERAAVQATVVALLETAAAALDPARPGDWPTWRLIVPHMDAAIELLAGDPAGPALPRLLAVAAAAAEALLGNGRLAAAERLAQASVAAAAFLIRDDPAAMTARGGLARTLVRSGRRGEAETLYRELLADRIRAQGRDHLATLTTRRDLAEVTGLQGRYAEAEELYRQLVDDDLRLLGPAHQDTLTARHYLARIVGRRGRYAEARELGREVLANQAQLLGNDHPDTLATCHSLARIVGMAGHHAEAEQMYREVLDWRRQILGAEHLDTIATRHQMAWMIGLQGRYSEAEETYREVLADRRRLLGEDHPDTLSTEHRLARMLGMQGRYPEAKEVFQRVLAARRRILGDEHPDTLATAHRLAWLVGRQGRYGEATEMVRQVLGGRRRILGDDHPDTLAARETLTWLTGLRAKLGEAEELGRNVLADRRRVLGDYHPDTLTSRATLAWLTELKERHADAEQQYRGVLADRRRVLGADHPDTLTTRQDLARTIGMQHRYEEAEQLSREVLADQTRVLGDDHPDTLTSPAALAWLAARRGRQAEAEALYRQVLADRKRVLGDSHPDTEATRDEFEQFVAERTGTDG